MSVVPYHGSPEVLFIGVRSELVPSTERLIERNGGGLEKFAGPDGLIARTVDASVGELGPNVGRVWSAVERLYTTLAPVRKTLRGQQAGASKIVDVVPALPNPDWKPTASKTEDGERRSYGDGQSRFLFLAPSGVIAAALSSNRGQNKPGLGGLVLGVRLTEPYDLAFSNKRLIDDMPNINGFSNSQQTW